MNGCTFLNNYSKSFLYMNPPATIIQLYNYFIVFDCETLFDGRTCNRQRFM